MIEVLLILAFFVVLSWSEDSTARRRAMADEQQAALLREVRAIRQAAAPHR